VSVQLATHVDCSFIGDLPFYETILLHFKLHLFASFTPFYIVC
jgi:hypothetical protein